MTDRQLAAHLGRALATFASIAILLVSGTIWSETTHHPTSVRTVDVSNAR